MAGSEPVLPLDLLSMQTVARDQIIDCIDAWLVEWDASKTIAHAGMVTPTFLREQTGRGLRNVVTILGGASPPGGGGRLAGGAETQWEVLWGWFLVIPGVIQDRSTDAATLTGEAVRFITATPWLHIDSSKATGTVRFTGTNGSAVGVGEVLERNDDVVYTTTAAGVIAGGQLDLAVEASEPGTLANTEPQAKLTLPAPPAGVDAVATVLAPGLRSGADKSAFAKTPRAGTIQLVPLYKDKDEDLGLSIWMLRWRQEICLGPAQRARVPGPDILTRVQGTSTIEAFPNDDAFTQIAEQ
jgi:hypothetical protein